MKKGWTIKMLADTCEVFADGDWIESKDQSTGGVRLIQTGNIGEGVFKDRGEKARYVSEATFKRLRCTEIYEGDCLISRLPDPVGRSCIIPDTGERMITAVDCTIVRFDHKQIIPKFFIYYSQSQDYLNAVDAETTGTTRKRISRSNLGQVPIPIPSVPEQQRIVDILDEAFDSIATAKTNAKKNLQNARALFESHLQAVFAKRDTGWMEMSLVDAADAGCSLSYGIVQPGEEYSDGLPVVRPTDLTRKVIQTEGLKRIDPTLAESYRRTILAGGELLLCVRGSTGTVSIASDELAGANVTRGIVPIRFNSTYITQEFGYYLLVSDNVQAQIKKKTYGAALMQINIRDLRGISLQFPNLQEQQCIAKNLDALIAETQRLEAVYRRKLAALDELKKSLLHRAFTGEL
jgi:type I restriction enzyme S subunit